MREQDQSKTYFLEKGKFLLSAVNRTRKEVKGGTRDNNLVMVAMQEQSRLWWRCSNRNGSEVLVSRVWFACCQQ